MARGWESKSVEEQIAAAEAAREISRAPLPKVDDQRREADRLVLMLARARILQDLQTTCNPLRRAQLDAALADVDEELRTLG